MKGLLYLFRRYKLASSLNLLGLVIAFTGCYILLTQINFIGRFNHGIKDYENIRRIYIRGAMGDDKWNVTCSRGVIENFKKCPQVQSLGYLRYWGEIEFDKDGSILTSPSYLISDDMLTTINTELVDGTLDGSKAVDGGIIIPASFAEKYFGEVMVAGKSMKQSDGSELNVVGVYKDFPVNSNFANAIYVSMGKESLDDFNNWNYDTYIRTEENVDTDALNATLKKIFGDVMLEKEWRSDQYEYFMNLLQFFALPLDRTYMEGYDALIDQGNKTVCYILQLTFVLLLLIALINFANFSMAQAPIRLRSINTRKVMGESNGMLRLQLGAEGCVVSICAFAVSMLLAICIGRWEYIGEYTHGSVAVADNLDIVFLLAVVSILVGILSTFYSARYITSFQPALVLKGNFGLNPSGRLLRQFLVGLQMVMAFVMVIFVGILFCQRNYIYNSDYGYDKDELLIANLLGMLSEQHTALRSELEQINGVESVSFSQFALGASDIHMKWGRGNDAVLFNFIAWPVDWNYLRTLGIDVIEGRDFKETDSDVYIINEAMKKRYPEIEMDKPLYDGDLTVLGVCKNPRASTTHIDNNEEPLAFVIYGERYASWGNQLNVMYIRLSANTDKKALRKKVSQKLESFFKDHPAPELKFMDDILEQAYKDEMRFMTQIEVSTVLAFLITIIGVFCLTMFETEYRRKEIAIRKVMGSSVCEVLSLFTARYALPLILSFVIAAPAGYYISERWLRNFAEHTPIHWWLFPLAFLIVSIVVLLTVIVQSWRVATMNPVDSIKTE